MKNLLYALLLLTTVVAWSQKPCEIDMDVKDSLGTYKATKQALIYERSFAGNATNIFFTLSSTNGVLALETQFLHKSPRFLKASCFDAGSKIYLQLNNGKIVTLLYSGNETCGSLLRDANNVNNRVISGRFLFTKENFEDLATSPVTFMRVKYAGETVDFPFKTELISELDKSKSQPENYFINNLKCFAD